MRAWLLASILLLVGLALPGAAAAQAACPAPSVDAFFTSSLDGGNGAGRRGAAGLPFEVDVQVTGATRIEVAWGDGTTQVLPATADLAHTYAVAGRYPIDVVAVGACDGAETRSAPGRLTVDIGPPCRERRGSALGVALCDRARAALRVSSGPSATRATWLSSPCRDVLVGERIEPERPPGAMAAACIERPGPPGVGGAVRVRPGGLLTLRLGAPAAAVAVFAGTPARPTAVRLGRARAADTARREFELRVPRLPPGTRRLTVRARGDEWVAGLRVLR